MLKLVLPDPDSKSSYSFTAKTNDKRRNNVKSVVTWMNRLSWLGRSNDDNGNVQRKSINDLHHRNNSLLTRDKIRSEIGVASYATLGTRNKKWNLQWNQRECIVNTPYLILSGNFFFSFVSIVIITNALLSQRSVPPSRSSCIPSFLLEVHVKVKQ